MHGFTFQIDMEEERLIPSEEKKFQRPKSSPSAHDTVTGSVAVRRPFTASSISGGADLPHKLVQDGDASLQDMDETSRKQIIKERSESVGKSEALVHDNVKTKMVNEGWTDGDDNAVMVGFSSLNEQALDENPLRYCKK